MREILFRAKRISDGKWVEGDLVHGVGNEKGLCFIWEEDETCVLNCREHIVDPETISQYIGLCDKNGRKIWENDIVDMNRKGCGFKRIEKVFYEEGAFSPISVHGWECVPDADEIEVIGNIFDNPKLLEDI